LHALSTRNDSPETASRPFDKERDGFVLGEGGGCLILEEYDHAKKRGAKIYAELIGGGLSADAHHMTAPHPEGIGAIKVMENCLRDANVDLKKIVRSLKSTSTSALTQASTTKVSMLKWLRVSGNSKYSARVHTLHATKFG